MYARSAFDSWTPGHLGEEQATTSSEDEKAPGEEVKHAEKEEKVPPLSPLKESEDAAEEAEVSKVKL